MQPDRGTEKTLSTGLASLDSHLEGDGFDARSLLAVRAPPRSVGRRVLFNLCGERPVHYVALGHEPDRYQTHVRAASNVDSGRTTTESIPLDEAVEALAEHLEEIGERLETGATLLIDPMTPVETRGQAETAAILSGIRDVLAATDGLGVLLHHGGDERRDLPGGWVTRSKVDGILSVVHRTDGNDVGHYLAVDRLPMGQQFRDADGARTFELPAQVDMSLDTSKTLSP